MELASLAVDLTKGSDLTNSKIYSVQEQGVTIPALLFLAAIDKSNRGTIDFSKEPKPKSVQIILSGKAQ